MADEWAKLFNTSSGLVVAMLDSDDDGKPEISVRLKPPGLGVCKVKLGGFKDTDAGWDLAERGFANVTHDACEKLAASLCAEFGQQASEGDQHAER